MWRSGVHWARNCKNRHYTRGAFWISWSAKKRSPDVIPGYCKTEFLACSRHGLARSAPSPIRGDHGFLLARIIFRPFTDRDVSVGSPGIQQLLGELRDRSIRVKVCNQVVIQGLEVRVTQRRHSAAVIAAVAFPCLFCHLQHDDRDEGVTAGAVVQEQISTRASRKNLVYVHLSRFRIRRPCLSLPGRPWRRSWHRAAEKDQGCNCNNECKEAVTNHRCVWVAASSR